MHTCTQRDTSCVKQHSEVSAVNVVEAPGYISADQTLSNTHIFFPSLWRFSAVWRTKQVGETPKREEKLWNWGAHSKIPGSVYTAGVEPVISYISQNTLQQSPVRGLSIKQWAIWAYNSSGWNNKLNCIVLPHPISTIYPVADGGFHRSSIHCVTFTFQRIHTFSSYISTENANGRVTLHRQKTRD